MIYSTATLLAVLAATAVDAAVVPRTPGGHNVAIKHGGGSSQPRLAARGSAVNVPIKRDPASYSADPKERREFLERNDLATRSKYEARSGLEQRQDQETTTPFTNWRRDLLYSIEIEVGTPPQTIEVHMDTGSSDFYVYDKACTSKACQEVTKFDHEQSSTFQRHNTSAKTTLTYGTGYAYGYWSKDTVSVADFAVPEQVFLSAATTDAGYSGTNVSGLIGFGWPELSVSKEDPYWHTAVQQWADKRFGCFLERREWNNPATDPRPQGASPGGTLTLGGVDETLFKGDIKYYPVTKDDTMENPTFTFWKVDFAGVTINGKDVSTTDANKAAVVDTGSTLCYGPPDVVAQIYANVPGATKQQGNNGMWNLPCDTKADLSFRFGGDSYKINAADFIHTNIGNNVCTGAIIGQALGSKFGWVLGDTLLKNVYSVFQYEPAAVGFALLADDSNTEPTPSPECKRSAKRAQATQAQAEAEPYWNDEGKLAWRPALE